MNGYNVFHDDHAVIAKKIQQLVQRKPRSIGVTPTGRVLMECRTDANLIGVYAKGITRAELMDDLIAAAARVSE
ncbi:MAG: hypothetical protein JSR70_07655 [Proteobacteria bacterium]|nr:hypothetical protein [Pseudomonadota bacterium]